MDNINKKIKELRKKNKWTQSYMAQKLGITQGAYSQFENGDTDSMRVSTLRNLCVEFNLSADELLGLGESRQGRLITEFDPSFRVIMTATTETPVKGMVIPGESLRKKKPAAKPKKATAEE